MLRRWQIPLFFTMISDTNLHHKSDHDGDDVTNNTGINGHGNNSNNGSGSMSLLPTYRSIKETPLYLKAKEDLRDGNLESALSTIESCLTATLSQLSGDEFNVALAPLYYLYGTTLLYSVEENDALLSQPPQDQLQQPQEEQEEEAPEEKQDENEEEGQQQQQQQEMAEDIQVAWENLDLARTILHRVLENILPNLIVQTSSSSSNGSNHKAIVMGKSDGSDNDDSIIEQVFDLGQIYLRLGDIQKGNGNYLNAVEDYDMCKNIWTGLRKLCQKPENERKVAHCYYCIGEVYMMLANEAETQGDTKATAKLPSGEVPAKAVPSAAASSSAAATAIVTQAEIDQYRKMSIVNYWTCGQTFANVILQLCDQESSILESTEINMETIAASSVVDIVQDSSEKLKRLRSSVANRTPSSSSSSSDSVAIVAEIKEILDEIQEVIDSSISEAKVLRENLSQIKKNTPLSAEENECKDNGSRGDGFGSTTTIGFGSPKLSTTTTTTANANIPMLVAKKKKKTREEDSDTQDLKKQKST